MKIQIIIEDESSNESEQQRRKKIIELPKDIEEMGTEQVYSDCCHIKDSIERKRKRDEEFDKYAEETKKIIERGLEGGKL